MLRYTRIEEPWGSFVEAKINLPELLRQERRQGRVILGTVCDPYQPVEARFQLSRQVLEILGGFGFSVEILTKSDLVLRDIDLMQRHPSISVELTLTTLDERVRAFFEPGAPPAVRRLKAAEELVRAGIPTTVFFGPVLPYFSDSEAKMTELLQAIARTGVRRVLIDRFNYLRHKLPGFRSRLQKEFPLALQSFVLLTERPDEYTSALRERALRVLKKVGLEGGVVF